jgi:5-methylcytosine-specific restriction endonuclease McrA
MKRAANLYVSAEWRRFRAMILARDGYRCVICGINVAGPGQARVDHIKRVNDGGAVFDPANVRTLCVLHEQQSHREKGTGAPYRQERFQLVGCDVSGMPFNRKITQNAEKER